MVAIGDIVEVNGYHGVIRFIGSTQFAEGTWYGIELDEPVGRNDGSVQGRKYFQLDKYGLYGIFAKLPSIKLAGSNTQTSSQEQVSKLLVENSQLRRQLQKVQSEEPNDVIEFLTIQNSDLLKNIEVLQEELVQFQQKEDTHAKLQAVYVEMEKELRYQLEELEISFQKQLEVLQEENERLSQQVSERGDLQLKIKDLKSKLKIKEQHIYENEFLKSLYEISSNDWANKEAAQFKYLSRKILDDRIRNSFIEKQKCRFIFIILSEIAEILKEKSQKKLFLDSLGDVSNWITFFLEGLIPKEKIQIDSINNFLDSNSTFKNDCLLAVRCMEFTFDKILPDLLALCMENKSLKLPLEPISELYSLDLCIQKKCQSLLNQTSNAKYFLCFRENILVMEFFNIIFQEMFDQFESNFQIDYILQLTKKILQEIENIQVEKKEKTNINSFGSNNNQAHKTSAITIKPKGNTLEHWQNLFYKKETELKELRIQNQVSQQKLNETKIHEQALGNIKTEVGHLREHNEQLIQESMLLKKDIRNLQTKVQKERLKTYQLFPNEGYEDLVTELVDSEKLDLISEIRDLRQLVAKHVNHENRKSLDLDWLNLNSSKKPKYLQDVVLSNNIHSIGNGMLDIAKYSSSINLQDNELKKNYMENTKFKISIIDSIIKDATLN